jgi:hypothetical protein
MYACPHDGAPLVSTGVGEYWNGGGSIQFHEGSMTVRAGTDEMELNEFMGPLGPPGARRGSFRGVFTDADIDEDGR